MLRQQPGARDSIKSQFLTHYRNAGFSELAPCPLLPENETTTLFTGSVSNHFLGKAAKGESIFVKPEVILQPCLRFRYLRDMKNDPAYDPKYMTYFEMLGAFVPHSYKDIEITTCNFLSSGLGFPIDSLIIKAPDDNTFWGNAGVPVAWGGEGDSYYKWDYGDPRITGEGITIAVRGVSDVQEETFDLGNIIEIRQDNKPIGYEVAFGIESLMAALDKKGNLFDQTLVKGQTELDTRNPAVKKMLDAMAAATAIGTTGISYNPGRTRKNGRNDCYRGLLSVLHRIYTNNSDEIAEDTFISTQQLFLEQFDHNSNVVNEMRRFFMNQGSNFNFPA